MAGVSGSHWAAEQEGVQGRGIVSSPCGFGIGWEPLPPHLAQPGWAAVLETSENFPDPFRTSLG